MAEAQPEPTTPARRRRWRKRNSAVILLLVGALAAAVGVAWYTWRQLGDVAIGTGGVITLVAGVVVTLALGAGLIVLMVLSDKRGYDEGLGRE